MSPTVVRIFVSSPTDVAEERRRVKQVISRLNAEYAGRVALEAFQWEESYYSAHTSFTHQIPEASACDVVLAIFRGRLGRPPPETFDRRLPSGAPFPSGTGYEVLSSILARQAGQPLPDVYVFRHPDAPRISLDAADRAEVEAQWASLKRFYETWLEVPGGPIHAGFQNYADTDDLARQVDECLRQWLARHGHVPPSRSWDRLRLGSPFPGLPAFEADRSAVFFGRDLAVSQAIDRLRLAFENGVPFLQVLGASGAGKSSLLRAGIVPRLLLPGTVPQVEVWRDAILTPGPELFAALADVLLEDRALGRELAAQSGLGDRAVLARLLAGDPVVAAAALRAGLQSAAAKAQTQAEAVGPPVVCLALVIDQGERLFTETPPAQAAAFVALLDRLVRAKLCVALMVLRSDAYAAFQADPVLAKLREDGAGFDLRPPTDAEMEAMVTGPVAACDPPLRFEPPSLAARLVADARGGDALPLLQMTLQRLYDAERERGDGALRASDYRGMEQAVTETADDALAKLSAEAAAELPALLTALVTEIGSAALAGAALPRVTPLDRDRFAAGSLARTALVQAFVERRLLTSANEAGVTRIRPAHDALLRIWPRAVEILTAAAPLIRTRHMLEPLVQAWAEADEAAGHAHLDLSPALLAGAQQLRQAQGFDLTATMDGFIDQAIARGEAERLQKQAEQERRIQEAEQLAEARRRVVQRTRLGLAAALLFALVAVWQRHQANLQRITAQNNLQLAHKNLALATETADGLVFDLAQKFRDVQGVPVTTIRSILNRASLLQQHLMDAGETTPQLRRGHAVALDETAKTLLAAGDTQGALKAETDVLHIVQALSASSQFDSNAQRDVSVSYDTLGDVQVAQGDLKAALASYSASLKIRDRLAKADPGNAGWRRDLSASYDNLGDVQVAQGDLKTALASYSASLTIADRLAKADSANAGWQRNLSVSYERLGEVQVAQGDLKTALASYSASLKIRDRLAKSDPGNAGWQRDLFVSYDHVGHVRVAQGDLRTALANYSACLTIADRLAKADPGNAGWQRDLSVSYDDLGDVQVAQGDLKTALASYSASLKIRDRLAKADPGNAGWQRDLSVSYDKLGDVQVAQGDFKAALASYSASLTIRDRLAESNPGDARWQHNLALSYERLGDVQVAQGDLKAALDGYSASLTIRDRLARSDPGNTGWQHDLALSYERLGNVQVAQGDLKAALASNSASLKIRDRLAKADPSNAGWQRDLAVSNFRLAWIASAQNRRADELDLNRQARAIIQSLHDRSPTDATLRKDLSTLDETIAGLASNP